MRSPWGNVRAACNRGGITTSRTSTPSTAALRRCSALPWGSRKEPAALPDVLQNHRPQRRRCKAALALARRHRSAGHRHRFVTKHSSLSMPTALAVLVLEGPLESVNPCTNTHACARRHHSRYSKGCNHRREYDNELIHSSKCRASRATWDASRNHCLRGKVNRPGN